MRRGVKAACLGHHEPFRGFEHDSGVQVSFRKLVLVTAVMLFRPRRRLLLLPDRWKPDDRLQSPAHGQRQAGPQVKLKAVLCAAGPENHDFRVHACWATLDLGAVDAAVVWIYFGLLVVLLLLPLLVKLLLLIQSVLLLLLLLELVQLLFQLVVAMFFLMLLPVELLQMILLLLV